MSPLNGTSKLMKEQTPTGVLFQIGKEGILTIIANFNFMHFIYTLTLPVGFTYVL